MQDFFNRVKNLGCEKSVEEYEQEVKDVAESNSVKVVKFA